MDNHHNTGLYAHYDSQKESHGEKLDNLIIRPAALYDLASLACLKHTRSGGDLESIRDDFAREISGTMSSNLILVAETEGRVIGFGRARLFSLSENMPGKNVPEGWYLVGVIVSPQYRRRGVATELIRQRLLLISYMADEAYYFANALNLVTIELHERFGFKELTRDFVFPGVIFTGGEGILFRAVLKNKRPTP